MRERAPAKVNLVLHVGPARGALHEVCSLFAPLELADELEVEPLDGGSDEVVCPGVDGENLVERALAAFRRRAELPPLRVTVDKRIPVAAGLGGGSADAAASLRAANEIAGRPFGPGELRRIAAPLGSDVPSQVEPRPALVTGTGDRVEAIRLPPLWIVLVPAADGLSTAAVFDELDRLGLARAQLDPQSLRALAGAPPERLAAALDNDLEPAALSLRPELAGTLEELRNRGALGARLSGSGPTAVGLFAGEPGAREAATAIDGALVTSSPGGS